MSSLGVLVAVGVSEFEARLLDNLSGHDLHVVRRCVDLADLIATASSRQAQVAVVSAALRGLDAEVVTRLRGEDVAVVGVTASAASADEALLRSLGIDVVVATEVPAEVVDAIREARAGQSESSAFDTGSDGRLTTDPGGGVRRGGSAASGADGSGREPASSRWTDDARQQSSSRRGRVIAVWGPSGAPGRSTVALGLASELSTLGAQTTLLDCDVYGGSTAQLLGLLDESSGLLAATRAANMGTLLPRMLAAHARAVTPTLRVLTGIPRADRWAEVRPALLRQVIAASRGLVDLTVLDCGFSLELDEEISYD
ncbi:MAG: P-loop NTPase, partial [Nocardioidaceae bacterium]|nr:P-loop NTPase [Nocardioidaceae bacterium]